MEIKKRAKGKHVIYALEGNLDIYSAPAVKKQINMAVDKEKISSLTIDMANVPHMDSSGIALLAFLHKKMKAAGHQFALLSITNDIMTILRLSSLDSYFSILSSEDSLT